jgi:integrase
MAATRRTGKRDRGSVRTRGGSHQVIVYAGVDPVTGKDVYLRESTQDEKKIPEIQSRLLAKVDQQRSAATRATLSYTIDAWLELHEIEESTLDNYRSYVDRVIKPALGDVPISKLNAQALESFYAQLRKCSERCNGRPFIEHRENGPHECRTVRHRRKPGRPSAKSLAEHDCELAGCTVVECKPHVCKPFSRSTVRQIHAILSGALDTAVRWEWIPSNPASVAKRPKQQAPRPHPPTASEAARIVAAAWEEDLLWGLFVWLVLVTGARRGELLALRWSDINWDEGVIEVRRSYTQRRGKGREKDTKTHQIRRVGLDPDTLELLAEAWEAFGKVMAQLGAKADPSAFIFSYQPDHSKPCNPDAITHRYSRMCARLGIDSHLHAGRHYSATELIGAGVDIRTIAGRLGHGGGGTTTLRVYAAWLAESDKRAAGLLAGRIQRPAKRDS